MDWVLPTYRWKGKTYKTLKGLHNRAMQELPFCGLSFQKDAMVLSQRLPDKTKVYYYFTRTMDGQGNSTIEDSTREVKRF